MSSQLHDDPQIHQQSLALAAECMQQFREECREVLLSRPAHPSPNDERNHAVKLVPTDQTIDGRHKHAKAICARHLSEADAAVRAEEKALPVLDTEIAEADARTARLRDRVSLEESELQASIEQERRAEAEQTDIAGAFGQAAADGDAKAEKAASDRLAAAVTRMQGFKGAAEQARLRIAAVRRQLEASETALATVQTKRQEVQARIDEARLRVSQVQWDAAALELARAGVELRQRTIEATGREPGELHQFSCRVFDATRSLIAEQAAVSAGGGPAVVNVTLQALRRLAEEHPMQAAA
jgi:hypothetical protein